MDSRPWQRWFDDRGVGVGMEQALHNEGKGGSCVPQSNPMSPNTAREEGACHSPNPNPPPSAPLSSSPRSPPPLTLASPSSSSYPLLPLARLLALLHWVLFSLDWYLQPPVFPPPTRLRLSCDSAGHRCSLSRGRPGLAAPSSSARTHAAAHQAVTLRGRQGPGGRGGGYIHDCLRSEGVDRNSSTAGGSAEDGDRWSGSAVVAGRARMCV